MIYYNNITWWYLLLEASKKKLRSGKLIKKRSKIDHNTKMQAWRYRNLSLISVKYKLKLSERNDGTVEDVPEFADGETAEETATAHAEREEGQLKSSELTLKAETRSCSAQSYCSVEVGKEIVDFDSSHSSAGAADEMQLANADAVGTDSMLTLSVELRMALPLHFDHVKLRSTRNFGKASLSLTLVQLQLSLLDVASTESLAVQAGKAEPEP